MSERFVVYAHARTLERAAELGFDGVLENAVTEAILAGRVRSRGSVRLVEVDGLLVHTQAHTRTPSGRLRVLAVHVERAPAGVRLTDRRTR